MRLTDVQRAALRRCALSVFLGVVASQAFAQFGGGPPGRGGMGRPSGGMERDGPPAERRAASVSGDYLITDTMRQLDNVRYQLGLRPEQEQLWAVYQEKIGALIGDQLRPRRETTGGNALQQIERKIDVVRNRLAALEEIAYTARSFYQHLDAPQQEKADRLLPTTLPAMYSGIGTDWSGEPGGRLPDDFGGRNGPPSR
jgi:hypothetical protein